MKANFKGVTEEWIGYFTSPEMWTSLFVTLVKIILIVIVGRIIIRLSRNMIKRLMIEKGKQAPRENQRRAKTLAKLSINMVTYAVNFVVILIILSYLGIELAPLLAGVGIVGIIIGFGAQSLVKDICSGFFIVFEDQFSVGDVVQIGEFKGTVEIIGLRTTKLKSWTGEVHIIPNGSIKEVTNFSLNNSVGVLDISIAYETNTDLAISLIRQEAVQVYRKNDNIVKEPEVLGVESLRPNEVVIRITVECKPNMHDAVLRTMKAEIKKALETNGIDMAHPKISTYQM